MSPLAWRSFGATLGASLLFAAALCHRSVGAPSRPSDPPPPVREAAALVPPTPPAPITLDADATRTSPTDLPARQAVIDAMNAWEALPNQDPGLALSPDWRLWARMDASACPLQFDRPADLPAGSLSAYAIAGNGACTLCLINHTAHPYLAHVRVRLPHGVYTIERLAFAPPLPLVAPGPGGTGAAAPSGPTADLQRLEGREMASEAVITKDGLLGPGQVVFYRYTDQGHAVRSALAEAYEALHQLAVQTPGPVRKLRQMLNEGRSFVADLADPPHGFHTLRRRLIGVHGLAMVTAQAHSLHRDYQMRGTIDAEAGGPLMGALERLLDDLAEYSAVALGLVPQVRLEPSSPAVSPAPGPVSAQNGSDRSQTVEVSLANTGEHAVASVKLGLPTGEMPAGTTCEPADAAFFGTLKPGQAVHAEFHLHRPEGESVPGSRCVADVCFLAGGGPVHLRPRPW